MSDAQELSPFTKDETVQDYQGDGVRTVQPFVSTVHGAGDFRPHRQDTDAGSANPKDVSALELAPPPESAKSKPLETVNPVSMGQKMPPAEVQDQLPFPAQNEPDEVETQNMTSPSSTLPTPTPPQTPVPPVKPVVPTADSEIPF